MKHRIPTRSFKTPVRVTRGNYPSIKNEKSSPTDQRAPNPKTMAKGRDLSGSSFKPKQSDSPSIISPTETPNHGSPEHVLSFCSPNKKRKRIHFEKSWDDNHSNSDSNEGSKAINTRKAKKKNMALISKDNVRPQNNEGDVTVESKIDSREDKFKIPKKIKPRISKESENENIRGVKTYNEGEDENKKQETSKENPKDTIESISLEFDNLMRKMQNNVKEDIENLKCLSNKENFISGTLAKLQYANKSKLNKSMNNILVFHSNEFMEADKYLLDNESNKNCILKEIPQNNLGNNSKKQLVSRCELDQATVHYELEKKELGFTENNTNNAEIKDELKCNLLLHSSNTNKEPSSKEKELSTQEDEEKELSTQDDKEKELSTQEDEEKELSTQEDKEKELSTQEDEEKELSTQEYKELSTQEGKEKELPTQRDKEKELSTQENKEKELSTQEDVLSNIEQRQKYIMAPKSANQEDVLSNIEERQKYILGPKITNQDAVLFKVEERQNYIMSTKNANQDVLSNVEEIKKYILSPKSVNQQDVPSNVEVIKKYILSSKSANQENILSNIEESRKYILRPESTNPGKVSGRAKQPSKPFSKMTPEEFKKFYSSTRSEGASSIPKKELSTHEDVLSNLEEKRKYKQSKKITNPGEVSARVKRPNKPFSKMTPEEFEKYYTWSRSEEPISKEIQGLKSACHGKVSSRVMKSKKPFSRMTPEEFKNFYIRSRNERRNEYKSSFPDVNDKEIDGIILPSANEFGVFELFITDNEHTNVLNGIRKAKLPRCRSILVGLSHDIDPDKLSPIRDFDGHLVIYFEELIPPKIDWAIKALIRLAPENGLPWNLHLPDCKLELKDIEVFLDCLVREKINIEGEITIGLDERDPEEMEEFEDRIYDNYNEDIEGIVIITPAAYWQEYCGNVFWKGYTQSNFWPFGEDFLKKVDALKTKSHNFDYTPTFSGNGNIFPKKLASSRKIDKEERNITQEIVSVENRDNLYAFGVKCMLFHAF